MSYLVCGGAMCQCSYGAAPTALTVLPANRVLNAMPAATVMDFAPIINLATFGMCSCTANPAVIAATAAAMGVQTPAPCVPAPTPGQTWSPGCDSVSIGPFAALDDASTLSCMWGGSISVKSAGQTSIEVP